MKCSSRNIFLLIIISFPYFSLSYEVLRNKEELEKNFKSTRHFYSDFQYLFGNELLRWQSMWIYDQWKICDFILIVIGFKSRLYEINRVPPNALIQNIGWYRTSSILLNFSENGSGTFYAQAVMWCPITGGKNPGRRKHIISVSRGSKENSLFVYNSVYKTKNRGYSDNEIYYVSEFSMILAEITDVKFENFQYETNYIIDGINSLKQLIWSENKNEGVTHSGTNSKTT